VKNNSAEATGISGGLESLCNTGISNSFFILYLTLISVDTVGVDIVRYVLNSDKLQ